MAIVTAASGGSWSVTRPFRYFIHPRGGRTNCEWKFSTVGSRTRYTRRNVKRVRILRILALNHRGSIPGMLHSSRSNVSDAETESLAESSNLLAEETRFSGFFRSHRTRLCSRRLDSTDGCGFEVVSFLIRACWFFRNKLFRVRKQGIENMKFVVKRNVA